MRIFTFMRPLYSELPHNNASAPDARRRADPQMDGYRD
ncbi:hypothetical protein D1AOALGA4SA_1218 [Olavius algarvensis Delta 1 endosymbiont]|nr:hypothetical protein D1AOALGA4SA_1218 [Olavius algarvensis Delta 1 endosymbiont]